MIFGTEKSVWFDSDCALFCSSFDGFMVRFQRGSIVFGLVCM